MITVPVSARSPHWPSGRRSIRPSASLTRRRRRPLRPDAPSLPIGQTDRSGTITKTGDALMRHALYEAATSMLVHATKPSALRNWALVVAKRRGLQKARVALARRLAVVLHRMWRDGSVFQPQGRPPTSELTAIEIRARRGVVSPWGRGLGEDGAVPVPDILRCRGRVREINPAALQHPILRRPGRPRREA